VSEIHCSLKLSVSLRNTLAAETWRWWWWWWW